MTATVRAVRYHDISCGHRVAGHESKCKYLHGHNYRVHFHCEAPDLDLLGRVIDFSVIKSLLCQWLEDNWDHKTLLWANDPWFSVINDGIYQLLRDSIVQVPFNPTAENIGLHLLHKIGPVLLKETNVVLVKVGVDETRKCSVEVSL